MKNQEKKLREPLFHIVKRGNILWWQSWLVRLAAVAVGLVFCAVVSYLLTGEDPLGIYGAMLSGSFGTSRRIWNLMQNIAMLLCVSLAVTPAFKMRFWNIGAEGQVLMGGMAAAACMILLGDKLPQPVLLLVLTAASIVAGALWALIPAVFKAKWGTNETLFTLMMNYIAIQVVCFFSLEWSVPKGSGQIGVINAATEAGNTDVLRH